MKLVLGTITAVILVAGALIGYGAATWLERQLPPVCLGLGT